MRSLPANRICRIFSPLEQASISGDGGTDRRLFGSCTSTSWLGDLAAITAEILTVARSAWSWAMTALPPRFLPRPRDDLRGSGRGWLGPIRLLWTGRSGRVPGRVETVIATVSLCDRRLREIAGVYPQHLPVRSGWVPMLRATNVARFRRFERPRRFRRRPPCSRCAPPRSLWRAEPHLHNTIRQEARVGDDLRASAYPIAVFAISPSAARNLRSRAPRAAITGLRRRPRRDGLAAARTACGLSPLNQSDSSAAP